MIKFLRRRSGLTLRALAAAANTSHSALAAYESERVSPQVSTLERIVRSAGWRSEPHFVRSPEAGHTQSRGDELLEVLQLAALFPARHDPALTAPPFGRR